MGNKMDECNYHCLRLFRISSLRMRRLKTAGIVLNTIVICIFLWCIVVGVVLSMMLNGIIDAPTQTYASLSVLIFMTGALGLIVSLPAFNCIKKQGKCGLITYVCMLWITTASVLAGAVQLISVSDNDGKLFEWVDVALKEVFNKAADSVKGMEAAFLIENQPCRDAFVESFQYKFKDFGGSLIFAVFVLLAAIINAFLILAKLRCDED